ncbi:MAG: hypothetical protein A3B44_03335 [Candidatus Levybacteria bacterium RIFCSPLOWO2_01_FULL_38_21]|nr:MAG: hypothetical protein A3B44_03335 [Candidatus Levybacteria bacterium RIFCSPLOWO2_01_FULL_38_21]
MISAINTKVLISGAVILAAAALIIGATFAFFSDTETSTGNLFAAGAIDLKIDNESYITSSSGALVFSQSTSWSTTDLTTQRFFDFTDLKPGDIGEDTISIEVGSNDAWLCAATRITQDTDETCTDPESESTDPECSAPTPTPGAGELDSEVNFAFWKDDGDNVLESDEVQSIFLQGPISGLGEQGQIALVDGQGGPLGPSPVPGGSISYIGKAWCFGTPNATPVTQDGSGKLPNATNGPLVRGTGFACDGEGVNNAAQTDKVVGDIQFYAVQSRNNAGFDCDEGYTPSWEL